VREREKRGILKGSKTLLNTCKEKKRGRENFLEKKTLFLFLRVKIFAPLRVP
jgi:hypothetical protein